MKKLISVSALLALLLPGQAAVREASLQKNALSTKNLSDGLTCPLETGQAVIWYLGHAGWAVRTTSAFLIFDYADAIRNERGNSLAGGAIDPREIRNHKVYVFVSHAHGDHWDPVVMSWRQTVPDITYIFGWNAGQGDGPVYLDSKREAFDLGNMRLQTIHHSFDGIPEAAFLITIDGLSIYFSGDHGSTGKALNPLFKDNIDFLAARAEGVDLAFISQFGSREGSEFNPGDRYTIEKLRPRLTMPMHQGGGERFYKKFAEESSAKGIKTRFFCAEKPGDVFVYR